MASRQEDLEARLGQLIQRLAEDFSDLGAERSWSIARALIHAGVHHAADGNQVEFCTLATYLGDMVGHAHKISHGNDPRAQAAHKDMKH